MYVSKSRAKGFFPYLMSAALTIGVSGQSMAFPIDAGSDWQVRWDNSLLYNLGFRAQSIDDGIGNNPFFS